MISELQSTAWMRCSQCSSQETVRITMVGLPNLCKAVYTALSRKLVSRKSSFGARHGTTTQATPASEASGEYVNCQNVNSRRRLGNRGDNRPITNGIGHCGYQESKNALGVHIVGYVSPICTRRGTSQHVKRDT